MTSFLLIISFLLHIILLMTVYYLFQQIQLLKQDNTKELTDLFETYLQEIKIENERLQKEITLNTSQPERKMDDELMVPHVVTQEVERKTTNNEPALQTDIIDDTFETSLEAQILQLHHQGEKVEVIAKKLNCGTTEAALIINLNEKRSHKA